MDPGSMIVAALVAGAAAATKDAASQALKDVYHGLRNLAARRFKGHKSAEIALDEVEKDPATWQMPLTKVVSEHGLDQERDAVDLAQKLLELVRAEAPAVASKYSVHIEKAQGLVIGDNAQVTQHFGEPPKSSEA